MIAYYGKFDKGKDPKQAQRFSVSFLAPCVSHSRPHSCFLPSRHLQVSPSSLPENASKSESLTGRNVTEWVLTCDLDQRKRTNADESITAQAASTSATRTTRSASRNTGAATQGSTSGASNSVAAPSNVRASAGARNSNYGKWADSAVELIRVSPFVGQSACKEDSQVYQGHQNIHE